MDARSPTMLIELRARLDEALAQRARLAAVLAAGGYRGRTGGAPPVEAAPATRAEYERLLAALEAEERAFFERALAGARGNKARLAEALGLSRYALLRALKRLRLGP